MADFGLAAQIGRGNAMPGAQQQQDPQNRMMQMMQLQQLQQNMMLAREQEARAAGLYGLQRQDLETGTAEKVARIGAVKQQTRRYTTEADAAEMDQNARRGVVQYLTANSANPRDPKALAALAGTNPLAHDELIRRFGETDTIRARSEKEGALSLQARNELAQAAVNNLSWTVDAVENANEFQTLRRSLVGLDPTAADYIPEKFDGRDGEAMRRLRLRLGSWKDTAIEEDAGGRKYLLNKRTGGRRYLPEPEKAGAQTPPPAVASPFGSTALTEPALGANADAATFNAAREFGAATPPSATPIIGQRAPTSAAAPPAGLSPKAAADFQSTFARETAQAGVKRTEKEIDLAAQLDSAIAEISAAAVPGGLISKSTGSILGNAIDTAAAFIGVATPGAIAIGKLAPIADLGTKLVPRFEGPQSDGDRKSYERASADIANPNVPNAIRIEAANELVRLMKKRRNEFTLRGDTATSPARSVTRTGMSGGRRVNEYSDGTIEYAD
jgi:hypothetical protein